MSLKTDPGSRYSLHSGLFQGNMANSTDVPGTNNDFALLTQLNNAEIQRLIPLIVYLILISLVGIPGNGIVYYIYRTQYKRSNSRYFILCLSAIDFFTCMFVIPFELFTVLNQYTYEAEIACKLARFCNSTPTVATGFMFLLIAIDRYRKVCQPISWQIRPKIAKVLCVGTILVGVLFSWPLFILYGKKTFPVDTLNMNGTECSTSDAMKGKLYPVIYNSFFGLLFLVGTMSLVTLYAIIGRAISKHAKDLIHFQSSTEMRGLRNDSNDNDLDLSGTMDNERSGEVNERSLERNTGNHATTSSSIGENSDVIEDTKDVNPSESTTTTLDRTSLSRKVPQRSVSFENDTKSRGNIYKKSPTRSVSYDHSNVTRKAKTNGVTGNSSSGILKKLSSIGSRLTLSGSSEDDRNQSRKRSTSHKKRMQRSRKMSFIMFLITLAYILSYLPNVSLLMIRGINSGFVDSMTDGQRAVYKFFLRSYFLNCVVNPFIYSVCDTRFRKGIERLIRCS